MLRLDFIPFLAPELIGVLKFLVHAVYLSPKTSLATAISGVRVSASLNSVYAPKGSPCTLLQVPICFVVFAIV